MHRWPRVWKLWTPPGWNFPERFDQAVLGDLRVGIPESAVGVGPMLGAPGLARLRTLEICGEEHGFGPDEFPFEEDHRAIAYLSELLASPQLAGLESLSLQGIALGDKGAQDLANGPIGRHLVSLSLDLCGLTGAGLRALRPLLAEGRLRNLSLTYGAFVDEDIRELGTWPEFGRLHRFCFGTFNHCTDFGDVVSESLKNSPHRHRFLHVS
jgi:hypothetical protein